MEGIPIYVTSVSIDHDHDHDHDSRSDTGDAKETNGHHKCSTLTSFLRSGFPTKRLGLNTLASVPNLISSI